MGEVAEWYAEQLQGLGGADARDYLKRRGIEPGPIARFGLGLAPDSRTALKRALAKLGEDRLIETGMLIQPEEGGKEPYDRFRGRLMIPIRDPRGRVIAFGGRILGEGEPKYLNSPDTPLFDKGRTLYNIDRAAPASRTAKRLIVVEGYMDVIALDRAGIAEVVAPNGTAVTEAQLERMWRLDPAPILCFDGDSAGRKAAIRAALRALPFIATRAHLALRRAAGRAGSRRRRPRRREGRVRGLLASPEPLDARLWRHELRCRALDHARGPRRASPAPDRPCRDHRRPGLRQLYRDQWLGRFDEIAPRRAFAPQARRFQRRGCFKNGRFVPPAPPVGDQARAIASSGIDAPTARALILGFANFPEELPAHCEQLAALAHRRPRTAKMRDALVNAAFSGAALDREALATILGGDGATGGRKAPAPWVFPSPAATATRTAPEAISLPRSRSSLRRRKWKRPWSDATERLKRDLTDEALDEQQRLIAAQQGLRQRLAHLAGTD